MSGDLRPLTDFGLPLHQAQRFMGIDRERLEVFAEIVFDQRVLDLSSALPLTAQILGHRLHHIAREFTNSLAPEYPGRHEYALSFCRFLNEGFKVVEPTPLFLRDVLNYEMVNLELYETGKVAKPSQSAKLALQLHDKATQLAVTPCRLPNNRVLSLDHDISGIISELKAGRIPVNVPKESLHVLLCLSFSGMTSHDRINFPTKSFLEACEGIRSLHRIIERLAVDFSQTDPSLFPLFERQCADLCASLVKRGVIKLESHQSEN
jgi:hypothetical protein